MGKYQHGIHFMDGAIKKFIVWETNLSSTYRAGQNIKVLILTSIDRIRETAGSMEENWLSCQAEISSSGCYFLVMTDN